MNEERKKGIDDRCTENGNSSNHVSSEDSIELTDVISGNDTSAGK